MSRSWKQCMHYNSDINLETKIREKRRKWNTNDKIVIPIQCSYPHHQKRAWTWKAPLSSYVSAGSAQSCASNWRRSPIATRKKEVIMNWYNKDNNHNYWKKLCRGLSEWNPFLDIFWSQLTELYKPLYEGKKVRCTFSPLNPKNCLKKASRASCSYRTLSYSYRFLCFLKRRLP